MFECRREIPEGHLASLFDKAEIAFEEDARKLLSVALSPLSSPAVLPPPLPRLPLSQFSLKTRTSVSSLFKSFFNSASSFILSRIVSPSSSRSDAFEAHGRQHLALDNGTYLFSFAPPAYCPAFSNPTIKYPSLSHRNPLARPISAFLFVGVAHSRRSEVALARG